MKEDTYNADKMSALLEYAGKKPVYMNCAYNFYKVKRIVDVGDYGIGFTHNHTILHDIQHNIDNPWHLTIEQAQVCLKEIK